jgi:hypothetical protein
MRIKSLMLGTVLVIATAAPGFAQGAGNSCDISGVWYGGSDPQYPYVVTITPIAAGRYQFVAQLGADIRPLGYLSSTNWLGEVGKASAQKYDIYAMSYWVWDPDAAAENGIDPSLPELDIVRSHVRFLDCNTFVNTIDVYGAYYAFNPDVTRPFVSPLDVDFMGGATLDETYRRMPTVCPTCPLPAKAARRR